MRPSFLVRAFGLVAVCSGLAALACGDAAEPLTTSTSPIINGKPAGSDEYPSTVVLWQNDHQCSGTKVGARLFMTAAHCVTSPAPVLYPDYQPGKELHLSAGRALDSQPAAVGKIVRTAVIAEWMARPYATGLDAPDVAVIELDSDTPAIPAAVVDTSPVAAGDGLAMLGYGCTAPMQDDFGILRVGDQVAVAGPFDIASPEHLSRNVVMVGTGRDASKPSLCPGDSGGPIFRRNSSWVVGIANVSMSTKAGGSPELNFDTRLDSSAQDGVNSFLRGVGANMGASVPVAIPFAGAPHTIPGTLQAEEYDLGGQGLGYNDKDASNNPHGNYRTEGVDLDETQDAGGGYNVGGTDPGEWLAFTTFVADGGLYNIDLRYAAETAARTLHVEVDGNDVTGPITLQATGGWQSFRTTTKTSVALLEGPHSVRVVFETGGVNLNWLSFAKRPCQTSLNGPCGIDCPNKCDGGVPCELAQDCISGACSNGLCTAPPSSGTGGSGGTAGSDGHSASGMGGQSGSGTAGQGVAGAPTMPISGGAGAGGAAPSVTAGSGGVTSGAAGAPLTDSTSKTSPASCSYQARSPFGSRSPAALLPTALLLLAWRRRSFAR